MDRYMLKTSMYTKEENFTCRVGEIYWVSAETKSRDIIYP